MRTRVEYDDEDACNKDGCPDHRGERWHLAENERGEQRAADDFKDGDDIGGGGWDPSQRGVVERVSGAEREEARRGDGQHRHQSARRTGGFPEGER